MDIGRLMALVPADVGLRRTARFFLWAGLGGVVLPAVPGWPLLFVSLALFSAGRPGGSAIDRWLGATFPRVRSQALRFAYGLMRDLKRRYPDRAPVAGLPAPASQ
jgi:hypothetical protein